MRAFKWLGAAGLVTIMAVSVQADLLIAWDNNKGTNTAFHVTGVSGNLFDAKSAGRKLDGNSTDGTYGSTFTGADTSVNWALALGTNSASITNNVIGIQIINNTGNDLVLDKLHFDAVRTFVGSVSNILVRYSFGSLSGVTNLTPIESIYIPDVVMGKSSDYYDFDISLTSLADYTLASGESATYQLVGISASAGSSTYVDNFAVSGTVVPEPATIGMLGLGALITLVVRRRIDTH